jgi:MFS transporter
LQELSSPQQRRLALMFLTFSLSGSFIGVFLPAYYLIIGSGSLNWALQFLAVQFIVLAILPSVLLRVFHARFEALLLASFPCYVMFYVLLLLRADPLLTGAVGGVALSLFWPAFQTVAIRVAQKDRVASTFTVLWLFVSAAASVIGPVAGGLVISFGGGFAAALSISAGLYLVALLSMWRFRFEAVTFTGRPRETQGPPRLNYLLAAVLVWGMADVSWLAYPLFALSVAGSYVNLGIVVSAIGVVTSVFGIWIARVSDRLGNRFGVWLIGVGATAFAYFALGLVRTIPELLVVSAVSGTAGAATGPVLIGWFAENYTKESAAPFWTRFELFLNPGRLVTLALAAFFLPAGNYAGYFTTSGVLGLLTIFPLYLFRRKGMTHRTGSPRTRPEGPQHPLGRSLSRPIDSSL